jgi:hypothetical protein
MAERADVREVGLRDGLQLVRTMLSAQQKLEWCRREAANERFSGTIARAGLPKTFGRPVQEAA